MRNLLTAISFIVLCSNAFGQVQNIYGNEAYVFDRLDGIRDYQPGTDFFQLNHFFAIRDRSEDPLWFNFQNPDSNTYSRLKYGLGTVANQYLHGDLYRPLSHTDFLSFNLDRQSFPGWMTNSHARRTRSSLQLHIGRFDRYKVRLDADLGLFDKQYNGGLVGDEYSISQNANSAFNLLGSDIFSEDSFNRGFLGNVNVHQYYRLNENDSNKLYLLAKSRYGTSRYRFFDSDTGYREYQTPNFRFPADDDIEDSTRLNRLAQTVKIGWNRRKGESDIMLSAGLRAEWFQVYNNGDEWTGTNQEFVSDLRWSGKSFALEASLNQVLFGYNAGNRAIMGRLSKTWIDQDSLDPVDPTDSSTVRISDSALDSLQDGWRPIANIHKRWYSVVEINARTNRPYMIYERYSYEFRNLRSNLNDVNLLSLNAQNIYERKRIKTTLGLEYQVIDGFVYFDSLFNVYQAPRPIQILAPHAAVAFTGDHLRYDLSVRYQVNSNDQVYSVPDFVADGEVSYNLPVFKKAIFIEPGIEGWYFSEYYARGYLGLNDQYYVQNSRRFGDYMQFNPFIRAYIKTVTLQFKFMNVTYGLIDDDPIVAPHFPSVPNYFMFSVDWSFRN